MYRTLSHRRQPRGSAVISNHAAWQQELAGQYCSHSERFNSCYRMEAAGWARLPSAICQCLYGTATSMKGLPKRGEGDNEEEPMTTKHQFFMTACALILSAGVANAGPCNTGQTTGTGDGQQAANRAAQADQRQQHAQPSVAQQPQSTGKAEQPNTTEQSAVPSAKMTDQDQSSAAPSQGSETSTKMADQGC